MSSIQNKRKSPDGIYEIHILKNEELAFFKDESDFEKYFEIIKSLKEKYCFKLVSYFITKKEARLIIKEKSEDDKRLVIKELSRRYSVYYKRKYKYESSVFKKGYKSFPLINNELIKAVVVMHNLPHKEAVRKSDEKVCSSYDEYFCKPLYIDSDVVFENIKKEDFLSYHFTLKDEETDEIKLAKEYIKKFANVKKFSDITYINKVDTYNIIKVLYYEKKLSVSAIANVLGRTRQSIYYILKCK